MYKSSRQSAVDPAATASIAGCVCGCGVSPVRDARRHHQPRGHPVARYSDAAVITPYNIMPQLCRRRRAEAPFGTCAPPNARPDNISIRFGKTKAIAASDTVPSRPIYQASTMLTPAWTKNPGAFGAAMRNNFGSIAPSTRCWVRWVIDRRMVGPGSREAGTSAFVPYVEATSWWPRSRCN